MAHLNKKNGWMYCQGHCPCGFETSVMTSKMIICYVASNCPLCRYQESDIMWFSMWVSKGDWKNVLHPPKSLICLKEIIIFIRVKINVLWWSQHFNNIL